MAKRALPKFTIVSVLSILAFVSVLACNSKKKACEHARDAMVEMTRADVRRALENAPEEVKADARALGDQQIASFNQHFVGACLEAPEDAMACIERVDELIAAGDAHRAKVDACFESEGGVEDLDCLEAARKELKKTTGECEETFEILLHEIDERAKKAEGG